MLIKEVVEKSNQFLKSKGIESSRLDTELIVAHILKMERIALYLKYDQPLSLEEVDLCRQKILQRSKGIPVAYIISKKYFYNYEFYVDRNVLIPRPETEILVEETLNWIKNKKEAQFSILELGCGSGCIIVALVSELQKLKVSLDKVRAIDISASAIEISKKNANKILSENQPIEFIVSDATSYCSDILKRDCIFDVIVSNPPYISKSDIEIQSSVKDFEPHLALFAEEEGLFYIKNWCLTVLRLLKPGGLVIFEIGCRQGVVVSKIFSDSNAFSSIELVNDYAGLNRFIRAVRNG